MRRVVAGLLALVAALVVAQPAAAGDRTLERYAEGTWRSFEAMTDEQSGLPADILQSDGTRSVQTSNTNIGAYMWSAVVAEELDIIRRSELVDRLRLTINTLEDMERHAPSGQFFNWYDHRTGEKLTVWPPSGQPHEPRLSSVDNGWLAVGLKVVAEKVPELTRRAEALYDSMDFGFYYRPDVNRMLFHYEPRTGSAPCCYDTIVSESRIAAYIGIAKGEVPERVHFGQFRSFPDTLRLEPGRRREPDGFTRTYFGTTVYDGSLPYAGMLVTPSWGGSMFEALMPALFLPEERWAPGSWGANHPLTVRAQIHHGTVEAGYGYWGFSPSDIPEGGYRTLRRRRHRHRPQWLPVEQRRHVDRPRLARLPGPPGAARPAAERVHQRRRHPARGVPRPALRAAGGARQPEEPRARLRHLHGLGLPRLGQRRHADRWPDSYLSLDQGMIMAAIGNALGHDGMRRAFATRDVERELRPVMGVEEFSASPRPCTITGTPRGDRLRGTRGDDVICGLGGDDVIDGRDGDDALFGDGGRDRLRGGEGEDTLYGGEGDDRLDGEDDRDVLSGGPGVDELAAGRGDHLEPGE